MMLSGDGPLADVMPCGTTINAVLEELEIGGERQPGCPTDSSIPTTRRCKQT